MGLARTSRITSTGMSAVPISFFVPFSYRRNVEEDFQDEVRAEIFGRQSRTKCRTEKDLKRISRSGQKVSQGCNAPGELLTRPLGLPATNLYCVVSKCKQINEPTEFSPSLSPSGSYHFLFLQLSRQTWTFVFLVPSFFFLFLFSF